MTEPRTSGSLPQWTVPLLVPLFSAAAVGLAVALTLLLRPFIGTTPFALLHLAVLLVTVRGGARAGWWALLFALVGADFFLFTPTGRFALHPGDLGALAISGAVAAAIVVLVTRLRGATRRSLARQREVERLNRLYDALSQVNQAIVWSVSTQELLPRICQVLVERGGFPMVWIAWHDPASRRLVPVASAGGADDFLAAVEVYADDRPEGRGPSGLAFRSGRPYISNDMQADPATLPWRGQLAPRGLRSAAVFPIRARGEVCATLSVYATERGFFQRREIDLLEEAANDISYALDNFAREEERRRAEAVARQGHELVDRILDSVAGVIYLYDESGRFLRWNQAFLDVTGYTADELVTMHPLDFFRGDDATRVAERIGNVFVGGAASVEAGFVAKDGTVTPYFFTGRRVELDGRPCLVGMGIDISERVEAEAELRQSEERFHTTLDSISEGCQLFGFDWRYLYLNDAAERHNRRPKEELLGRTLPEAWPGIEGTAVFALLRRGLEERVPAHEEIEFSFGDGTSAWYDVRVQPVPEGIFVLSIDVTDRRAAEAAAEAMRRRFEVVVEHLREGLVIASPELTLLHWNPAALRLLGFDDLDEGRRRQRDFDDLFEIRTLDGALVPPGRWPLARVRGGETIDGVELRVRRTDTGRERIFSYSGTRVEYGAGQQLAFMTLHDVTERHAAEAERARLLAQETAAREEAEQAHRQVDEILASVTDAWVTLDRDWRYVYVNERAARIFGRTREQLLGRHIWTEFPEGVGQPFQREYERAMRDRVEIQFEEYSPPLDAWFENRIFPSAEGISIVFQDISARKRAELALREAKADLERKVEERTAELQTALVQAEAADRIKSAFLATMSHELRTPLNSIVGFTGIVLQGLAGPLTPEQQKQLGMVRGSARHLLDLINDVLDISKIEAGQLEVRDEPVDLAALLERTVGTIRPLAAQKGLALETRIPDTLPALRSDRRRVEQILLNLLNNAVKFTDRGGVTLTVRAGPDVRLADRRPAVALAVADTGIGIRPADLQRLFQPFQQVDSGLSRQHEGTGLGLAICRRLAELLGGAITVQSTWGVGSTFTVTLPLAPGA